MGPQKPQILVVIPDNPAQEGENIRTNLAEQILPDDRAEILEFSETNKAVLAILKDTTNRIRIVIVGLFPEGINALASILSIRDDTKQTLSVIHIFDKTQQPLPTQPNHSFPYPVNIKHLRQRIRTILDGSDTQQMPRPTEEELLTKE